MVIAIDAGRVVPTVRLRGLEGPCVEFGDSADRVLGQLDHLVNGLLLLFVIAVFDKRLLFIFGSAVDGHIIVQHVLERELDLLLKTVLPLTLDRLGH